MSTQKRLLNKTGSRKNKPAIPREDKIFYVIVNVYLCIFSIIVLFPIINVVACSFSSGDAVVAGRVTFWPVDFSLEGYTAIFKDDSVFRGYANTIFYTVVGTCLNMFLTVIAAWPLSRRDLPGRNFLMMFFTFTMLFNGGMIPNYLLMKDLKILNTRWALILPGAISVYNMIICKTFFQNSIPSSLMEAAQLDGCSEIKIFIRMVLPLSKAVLAVLTLYYAVAHWNSYFNAFLYLTDKDLYPLQLILRDILLSNKIDANAIVDIDSAVMNYNLAESMKYALILVASVPVWCIYPFVQKYFVKGVMIGAVKG